MAGSIKKRKGDSYRLVKCVEYNLKGKPVKKTQTVHCKIMKEAKIELAKFVADCEKGMYIEGKSLKFIDFVEIWKKDYGSKKLAPSTYKRYLRILPYFGHFHVDKIKPTDIIQFYDLLSKDTQIVRRKNNNGKKTGKPLSSKTIAEHHRLLHAMLQKAVYWQLILANPAERVQPPKTRKPKRSYYDDEQSKILVSNLMNLSEEQIKYKTAIILAVFTGVRRGELTGLTWDDVDLETGKVVINKTTQYIDKRIYEKETKSVSSDRINFINPYTIELLKKYKKDQLEKQLKLSSKWIKSNRVFTTDFGGNIHPDTPSKILKKVIKKYNLRYITFHGLRHTGISHMIARGFQTQIISRKVGHSSVQVTDAYYSHFFEDEFKQAANSMSDIFEKVQ